MKSVVECVPNFSEGRDRGIIDQIVNVIQSVPGLCIMDVEMDFDHHRSVVTFVGEIDKVGEGALRAIGKAAELIDLTKHVGAHPRIGATDVVPFVPVKNVTLEECVAIAKQVGEQTYKRFAIPVYLYEAAATRPDRVQLENIRKGQFEGLRVDIEKTPSRRPDFGVSGIHPTAGATVVGARKFLIAYNINLNTSDVRIAKNIAKSIRTSSGGLPHVKAMGVELKARNQAQVSMNLTDFEQTPVHHVFERVKREAEQYGTSIAGSEIVGLIPQRALEMAADFYLQIENFRPELVFENRLAEIVEASKDFSSMPVSQFLESVAAAESVPGGGSVAALAGALAAALGKMVLGFTLNRKKYESHQATLRQHLHVLEDTLSELRLAVDQDSQAYSQVMAALQLPKSNESEKTLREQKLQEALRQATEVPLQVAESAYKTLQALQELRPISNPNLTSDLNVGFWMAMAACQGALENVSINLRSIHDSAFVASKEVRTQEFREMLRRVALASL
ncbi:MAG: glutamate formimidoyltransferase [Acidobacteria bacterium]|nr:MAG: glutamate formimidoyltransferase [Acidobacteriota bacterium]